MIIKQEPSLVYCLVLAVLLFACGKSGDDPTPPVTTTPPNISIVVKPDFEIAGRDKFTVGDFNNFFLFEVINADDSKFSMHLTVTTGGKDYNGIYTSYNGRNFLGFNGGTVDFTVWNGIANGSKVTFKIVANANVGNAELYSTTVDLTKTPAAELYTWKDLITVYNATRQDIQLQNDIVFPKIGTFNFSAFGFAGFGDALTFNHTFDGKNHSIKNFPALSSLGGVIGNLGTIKNIVIELDPTPLAAGNRTINQLGVISTQNQGTITNCIVKGTVVGANSSASDYIGGITGVNKGLIQNCYVKGTITGSKARTGGIAGSSQDGTIKQSAFDGDITGENAVGGVVGLSQSPAKIINCYAVGTISSKTNTGGVVGTISGESITNCYFAGTITIVDALSGGGVIGHSDIAVPSAITSNYFDKTRAAGFAAIGSKSDVVFKFEGKTTSEMKLQSTYSGWDFVNVWAIDATVNNGYPYFR